MRSALLIITAVAAVAAQSAPSLPVSKIYGVNLGGWLVSEPWMNPQEWLAMGGESCSDCSTCIGSEFALVKSNPGGADAVFQKHWDTWFNQSDVDRIAAAGLNTVRIPLGYWIIEPLVDRSTEFYPRGGLRALKRALAQLKRKGIHAILDHHALPGVAASNQMFAGLCTRDVQFYTPQNYARALAWAGAMTALAHIDPDWSSVFAIQAINEPIMDASKTPGLGDYEVDFVKTVRAVERAFGIGLPGINITLGLNATLASAASSVPEEDAAVRTALLQTGPLVLQAMAQLGLPLVSFGGGLPNRKPLWTNFMDQTWQHNGPANPADAADGPQAYDDHLYYSFGGVADPNETAYLTHLCNLNRLQVAQSLGNVPLWWGEWSLATQFDASDAFLGVWADAQKLMYSQGAGWLFWSFKIEDGNPLKRQWDYFEGLRLGYFTQDPAAMHDPAVCAPYKANTTVSAA